MAKSSYLAPIIFALLLIAGSVQAENRWLPLPSGEIQRIAFGSCAKQWQSQPIWKSVIAADPDLFLFIGDAIYADTDGTGVWDVTAGQLAGEWNRLADKPEIQQLMATVPVMATWDNHDYGTRGGGAEFPVKRQSQQIFLDFFDEPTNSERRTTDGVYDAKIFGPAGRRVQIILLDTRFFRVPPPRDSRSTKEKQRLNIVATYATVDDPAVTLLGDEQWAWLEAQLHEPAELRLIASGTQIVPDQKRMDEWGNYPHERRRLFDLLSTTRAEGVILLSGNVHFGEISKLNSLDYPLWEITSSGLTHNNKRYAGMKNSYRVDGPLVENNFGLVEVNWTANPGPVVTLALFDAAGTKKITQSISLEELKK